jgi:lantibiotic modifying enzyme
MPSVFLRPAVFLVATVLSASAGEPLEVARGIGDHLLSVARRDGKAIWWQQYEGGPADAGEENRQLAVSLYNGLAGTGYFFLNLHVVTGEKKYLDAAIGIGTRLEALARPAKAGGVMWEGKSERRGRIVPDGDGVGLYSGNAGIGLFLMRLHKAGGDERFRKLAEAAFERVLKEGIREKDGLHWVYEMQDIIGGEAGIGLALLEMHRLTKNDAYRAAADDAGKWLLSKATQDEEGARWATYGSLDPNFSHGTAGIAFFLGSLSDAKARDAAAGAATWIESVAEKGGGGLYWKYYAGDPPEGRQQTTMHSWCHGAPGTVGLFIRLHRATGKASYLDVSRKAGAGLSGELNVASGKPLFANPTLCCGAAGCLDALCSVYQATKDERFLADARVVADAIVGDLRAEGKLRVYAQYDDADAKERKFPYYPTGLMVGNAGVGYAMLRLHAVASGKADALVLPPDQPFAAPAK